MKNSVITDFEKSMFTDLKQHPAFRPGDTLRVHYKVEESSKDGKKKYRIQPFEGVCLRFKKGTTGSSFTIRKIGANSVGVERVFPLYSPYVDRIDIISGGKVRRSRLYYLRELSGKAARIKARRLPAGTPMTTLGLDEGKEKKKKKEKKKTGAKKK